MPLALWALTISAFGIGTTEFVIMGLLPEVAADFAVSIPTAGYLISGYALGVVVGAPLLTALGTRVPRKRMLLGLMVLFIAGNLLSALATSYGLLLTGRVVASFAHGAFFGIGAVVAADLVAPHKRAGAIAIMFTGLTAANVLGVPMGTWLGQSYGWRSTFVVVSALGVIGFAGVAALVPRQPRPAAAGVSRELASLRSVQVWLAVAMTVLGFGGVFAAFTYVAPMMTEVAGYTPAAVTWLLVLFGVGLFSGNLVGGRLADRALMPSLYGILAALAVVLGLFTFTAAGKVSAAITLALVGAAGFATVPALQKRVMDKAEGAPTLASAVNIAAFNLGNALAAWLGGLVIEAGLGYTAPNWVGALMAAAALGVALFSGALDRRPARTGAAEPAPEPAAVR
ncbi:DHA1 family inner membrane transport protein [Saccharopolyspora erythraea NRRL 2338]|uniref:MFS transporter n=2 Tax=Saccharopolyspora erythraea TaxID=1836 RepID=A0ABN1CGM8_SACER|nr:MFS transporter [Saccharopolyspora erythraea]EQD87599.1 MFS transporter [Saccharopolyspora erythraea D]PFG95002.1 DHA1 family inner membrane transport protein [Saccharopolyspora erythraea NRRL 2338]QRK91691.1 MFS transporter [Saccharopolyspora erythraea]CAM01218.1 probable sugar efflux transporter, MFS superfamily [Saccharopolyspora erythraea NRRL 2338]